MITRTDIDFIIDEYEQQKKSPTQLWKKRKKSLTKHNEKRTVDIVNWMFRGKSYTEIYDMVFKDREAVRKKNGKPSSSEEKIKEVWRHIKYIKRIAMSDPENLLPLPDSLK